MIIQKTAFENGAYPAPQSWGDYPVPDTHAVWSETLDDTEFFDYNGFVVLTIEEVAGVEAVTSYEPNVEAWEAWRATVPEPEPEVYEPTAEEMLNALVGGMSYE